MSKCINIRKHEWYVFGIVFHGSKIECDIVCSKCGKTRIVVIKNTPKILERVLDSVIDHKPFKIPKTVYIRQY